MYRSIKRAAVIGAGVMGAGIAAHLANAGILVELLDIVPQNAAPDERSRIATEAKKRLQNAKGSPLFETEYADYIRPGNLEDDLGRLEETEFVIEAVLERMDIKHSLLEKLASVCPASSIIGTNTSGLSINEMAQALPESHRANFLGIHFFNPPRHMKLLEIIPADNTSSETLERMRDFATRQLGKGVVVAKDTPNFIANRIGVYSSMIATRIALEMGLTIEEADAIAGIPLARPRSAIFRTSDMVGIDLGMLVSENLRKAFTDPTEQAAFATHPITVAMMEKGLLGNKSGQGFYKKVVADGKKMILSLDTNTLEYGPQKPVSFVSLDIAKQCKSPEEAFSSLVFAEDVAGQYAWRITRDTLVYAADHAKEISDSLIDIDNALKWGFNWVMGPFEQWDALGVERVVERIRAENGHIPKLVEELLASGKDHFHESVEESARSANILHSNNNMTFTALGDGITLLEMHTLNSVAPDHGDGMMVNCLHEVEAKHKGIILASSGKNFCVGANLKQFSRQIEEGDWDELERNIYEAQQLMLSLKYCPRPVVAAVYGRALGGGAEMLLHTHRVRATADAMIGLVETGVGLIPAGGGLTEMTIRSGEAGLKSVFNTICTGRVAASAAEAKKLGFLREADEITMNRDGLIVEAEETVRYIIAQGYRTPVQRYIEVQGKPGYAVLCAEVDYMLRAGYITEYSAVIAKKIAYVMTGGELPAKVMVTEQYLLDLEREAFLHLCGQPKTQERIQHMLTKGRSLMN